MFLARQMKRAASGAARYFSTAPLPERKVTICGAAGGIGQPLSLLMKVSWGKARKTTFCLLGCVWGIGFGGTCAWGVRWRSV